MAPTRFFSFLQRLLDGGPDAELSGPDAWEAVAVTDGLEQDGIDVQAGRIVVLGQAHSSGRPACGKARGLQLPGSRQEKPQDRGLCVQISPALSWDC